MRWVQLKALINSYERALHIYASYINAYMQDVYMWCMITPGGAKRDCQGAVVARPAGDVTEAWEGIVARDGTA